MHWTNPSIKLNKLPIADETDGGANLDRCFLLMGIWFAEGRGIFVIRVPYLIRVQSTKRCDFLSARPD